jgi:5-methylcytosine-specific restriction endonuclease McrA
MRSLSWIKSNAKSIIRRTAKRCAYCNKKLKKHEITIDHLVPIALGGTDEYNNIVPACEACNNKKSGKLPLNFIIEKIDNERKRLRSNNWG